MVKYWSAILSLVVALIVAAALMCPGVVKDARWIRRPSPNLDNPDVVQAMKTVPMIDGELDYARFTKIQRTLFGKKEDDQSTATLEHGWPFVFLERKVQSPIDYVKLEEAPPWSHLSLWNFWSGNNERTWSFGGLALDLVLLSFFLCMVLFVWVKRRRLFNRCFSLSTMLWMMLLASVALAIFANAATTYSRQSQAISYLRDSGAKFNGYQQNSFLVRLLGAGRCPESCLSPDFVGLSVTNECLSTSLDELSHLCKLKGLSLASEVRLSQEDVEKISQLRNLRTLRVQDPGIAEMDLSSLQHLEGMAVYDTNELQREKIRTQLPNVQLEFNRTRDK